MKKFIEFVNEEFESDDEEAERKAKLKAALAATDHVAKGGMQKKGYTGSTYNPQKKVQKEELGPDDELNSRPGAWRSKADLNNRTKKDGSPTKHERGMQDNLKARIKMQNKSGGLTGPKGPLPEETELDEVAKPKGVVDKNVGKPPKESMSGFKTGQRVAHYRGMGKTLHGNVTNPDAVSGGKKGAMVKFEHGTEFVPHKELRDAHQYWKDEDEAMRKERDKPKMKLEETQPMKSFSEFVVESSGMSDLQVLFYEMMALACEGKQINEDVDSIDEAIAIYEALEQSFVESFQVLSIEESVVAVVRGVDVNEQLYEALIETIDMDESIGSAVATAVHAIGQHMAQRKAASAQSSLIKATTKAHQAGSLASKRTLATKQADKAHAANPSAVSAFKAAMSRSRSDKQYGKFQQATAKKQQAGQKAQDTQQQLDDKKQKRAELANKIDTKVSQVKDKIKSGVHKAAGALGRVVGRFM